MKDKIMCRCAAWGDTECLCETNATTQYVSQLILAMRANRANHIAYLQEVLNSPWSLTSPDTSPDTFSGSRIGWWWDEK